MVKYSARVHMAKDARACELNVYCEILGTRSYGGDALAMYIVKYWALVHMAETHEFASASPPYERVPNISQYTSNNLFIIYLSDLPSSFIRTIYTRNQNIISAYRPKNCFKFKITLCHLVSSYIFNVLSTQEIKI